jgi:hypothetical protein
MNRPRRFRASRFILLTLVLLAGAVVVACAPRPAQELPVLDATFISSAEIDSAHAVTAYDVIRKLRPQFLMSRGKLTLDPTEAPALPRVYVDDQFYGDASTLRGVSTGVIESIRFFSGPSAQQKYGHDNAAGVIAIVTKR